MHTLRARTLALALTLCAACDPKPAIPGESTAADETGEPTTATDPPTTTDPPTGDTGDTGDTGEDPTTGLADGSPCQLETDFSGGPVVAPDLACAGGVCLYTASVAGPTCDDDATCTDLGPFFSGCDDGACAVDSTWAAMHTACTAACETDVDCPDVPGCETGRICTPIALLGPLCCQPVCACRDVLEEASAAQRATECASGMFCH